MKTTSPTLHPSFQLNGLQYNSAEELLNFADGLLQQGDPHEVSMARFIEDWLSFTETVEIQTSGSTGTPKPILLEKSRMVASAKATGAYFKVGPGTRALLCLSPDYIAGKMMLVRAMVLGWDLHVVAPEADALTQYDNDYDFAAMVPYQVKHSIASIGKVRKLIIGGGAVSSELEAALQQVSTEVFVTYGMTETITHVAVRRLNGFARSMVYSALPEVRFRTDERNCLIIEAPNISKEPVITNDMVDLVSPTSFTWLGRFDHIVNSGGIKMNPEVIEGKLSPYIDLPFIVASEPDPDLGERLILVVETKEGAAIPDYAKAFAQLDKFERPKRLYTMSMFAYTETGKIKRGDVLSVLHKHKK